MLTLHRRVHDEDSLLDLLARSSSGSAVQLIDADRAGVTLRFAGEPCTAAHTDPRVLIVNQGQYGAGWRRGVNEYRPFAEADPPGAAERDYASCLRRPTGAPVTAILFG